MTPWMTRIVLVCIMFGLVISCSAQSALQSVDTQQENLQGNIALWIELPLGLAESQHGQVQDVLGDVIEEWGELYPQTEVFIKFFPAQQILEPFEFQVSRGAGPDLLLAYYSPELLRLIRIGALRSLDDYRVDESQFRPEALESVRYDDKLYGIPAYLSTQVLCYNNEKVETTALPKTLPALIDQARKGYSVGIHSGFAETLWGTGLFGGQPVNSREPVILAWQRGWRRWMEWLKEIQNEPNLVLSDDTRALQQAFVDGQLAYLTCYSDWIPYFDNALDNNQLGATLLPDNGPQSAIPPLVTTNFLFNQASSSNQTKLAIRLAQFITNEEQQKQIQASIPFIPSNQNLTFNPQLFPIRATLLEQSRTALNLSLDDAEKLEAVKFQGDSLYQKILAGEIETDEAARQMKLAVDQQLHSN